LTNILANYIPSKLDEAVEKLETWQPANWPPQRPADSVFGNLGDIINVFTGNSGHVSREEAYHDFPFTGRLNDDMIAQWNEMQNAKKDD
jgi:hypothetical protein